MDDYFSQPPDHEELGQPAPEIVEFKVESSKGKIASYMPHSKETKQHAFEKFCAGKTQKEISEETGVSMGTIQSWSAKHKWMERRIEVEIAKANAKAVGLREGGDAATQVEVKELLVSIDDSHAALQEWNASEKEFALRVLVMRRTLSDDQVLRHADKVIKLSEYARMVLGAGKAGTEDNLFSSMMVQGRNETRALIQTSKTTETKTAAIVQRTEGE